MSKEHLITTIEDRIKAEYRKHKILLDWPKITAIKIVHDLEELETPNMKNVDKLTKFEIEEEYYFLFGEGPCRAFNDTDIEGAKESIKMGDDFSLYKWNVRENTPMELLSEVSGYYDWYQLMKFEYDELLEFVNYLNTYGKYPYKK